jgi:hypothetical protein
VGLREGEGGAGGGRGGAAELRVGEGGTRGRRGGAARLKKRGEGRRKMEGARVSNDFGVIYYLVFGRIVVSRRSIDGRHQLMSTWDTFGPCGLRR